MRPPQQYLTVNAASSEITQAIAVELANLVQPGTILLLNGNLGSGKTTFVKGLGLGLGIQTNITSPTFTLIDEYMEGKLPLYHIDLYRLEPSGVKGLHLQEYWQGEDFPLGVVAIEWSERLPNPLPNYIRIDLNAPTLAESDRRQIDFYAEGEMHRQILEQLQRSPLIAELQASDHTVS